MIEFIEKNPWTDHDPLIGRTYAPVFMEKDGVEHFVVNRVVRDGDRSYGKYHCDESDRELEEIKSFLIQNSGKYFKFNGFYVDPFEMLKEMSERGHTFWEPDKLFDDCREIHGYGAGFVDFHGNRREVSAAFHYRIYDESMLEELKKALVPILKRGEQEDE